MKRKDDNPHATVDFANLVDWYSKHCDDDWEHQYGIRLETLDNPGWILTVDLIHTNLQGHSMSEVAEGCDPEGHPLSPLWIHCFTADNQFKAACDSTQIARLFEEFQRFVDSSLTA